MSIRFICFAWLSLLFMLIPFFCWSGSFGHGTLARKKSERAETSVHRLRMSSIITVVVIILCCRCASANTVMIWSNVSWVLFAYCFILRSVFIIQIIHRLFWKYCSIFFLWIINFIDIFQICKIKFFLLKYNTILIQINSYLKILKRLFMIESKVSPSFYKFSKQKFIKTSGTAYTWK